MPKDTKIFAFGAQLYQSQDYYRAIGEFKRLLFHYPNSSLAKKTKLAIAKSYRSGGEVAEAIAYLESLPETKKQEADFQTLLGLCYLDLEPAKLFVSRQESNKKALELFSATKNPRLLEFAAEAKGVKLEQVHSPVVAGSMSAIVPGLGSAGLGRYKEGLYAAFFTLGFGLAAVETRDNSKPELAAGFGFFALAFYGGSIYSAANSAHKLNNRLAEKAFKNVRNKHGIWFTPAGILIEKKF